MTIDIANQKRTYQHRVVRLTLQLVAALLFSFASGIALAEDEVESQPQFTAAEREQILAPIALYPDSLLTHILIASTYPLEIVQAHRLVQAQPNWDAEQLTNSTQAQQWDPSVVALLGFPTVLEKMSVELEWTQRLGDAFLQDEAALLASVQTLRRQAYEADTLSQVEHLTVSQENQQIVIKAADPQVIYVPYYDTKVVYGGWHWAHYPPVYWVPPHHHRAYYGHFGWHSGVHISFNYFFSSFHWGHHHHNHHVVVVNHRHSHHHRSHHRVSVSHGAQRWHHQAKHRRGVSYRSHHVAKRYNSHRPPQHYAYSAQHKVDRNAAQQRFKAQSGQLQHQLKSSQLKPKQLKPKQLKPSHVRSNESRSGLHQTKSLQHKPLQSKQHQAKDHKSGQYSSGQHKSSLRGAEQENKAKQGTRGIDQRQQSNRSTQRVQPQRQHNKVQQHSSKPQVSQPRQHRSSHQVARKSAGSNNRSQRRP